ncbi:unnamed protein product [Absidia cylindrospora]
MDSLPSPPASLSSGKNPWMVKKHQTTTSPTLTTTATSKLERFISFLLAAWTTLSSVQPVQQQQQQSSFSSPTPPSSSSSSSSSINNTKAVVTRSLLPTMASQCLDLIMFTSAMVITLFSYFSGELDSKKPISSSSSSSSSSHSHTAHRLVSSAPSPSIAIIPPPSRHTIMDIKELRKWQQQQQQHQLQQTPPILKRLEYLTATSPMDDQKHQRIMAWASSQGHQEQQQQESGGTEDGGRQLTSLSLHRQEQHYSHPVLEEVDDDEKYTFDERWSVDGGEPILMNSHHQHHLHLTSPSSSHRQLSTNKNNNSKYLHPNSSSVATSTTTSSSNNNNPSPEEDRRLAFMEVQVASLIQQGQAALTKKIKVHELDPKEIAMRRALKQGTSGGHHHKIPPSF